MVGIFAWLASAPLNAIGARVGNLMDSAFGFLDNTEVGIALYETTLSGSWILVILGAASAYVLAPLVEEMAFRGCLYRWCRVWMTWNQQRLLSGWPLGLFIRIRRAG